jgi:stage III sporulation protein AB
VLWLVKLAGAGLIVLASSYAGMQVAAGYRRRPRQLRDLQTGLAVLQTEIEYGATPLPEALRAAAGAAGSGVGPILARTAQLLSIGHGTIPGEALRQAVREVGPETALGRADLEILLALAPALGASGRHDQVRHLQLARERLAGEEARAAEERDRYERVARYAGVLSGLALALILL